MSVGNGKLRQWLIEQVDTGSYPGLVWETDDKSIFRIPWKHAGKQDYNREEDAALFKGWALFKGKFREGIDKLDPPTWKTRLRCALNKSNDFEELVTRSQLDISEPYKVYRVIPEGAKKGPRSLEDTPPHSNPLSYPLHPAYTPLQSQMCNFLSPERSWRDFLPEHPPLSELPYTHTPRWDNGYQISGSFYSCSPSDPQPSAFTLDSSMRSAEAMAFSDCRLQVSVFHRGALLREVTVVSAEGCRLARCVEGRGYVPPGGPELVALPQGMTPDPNPDPDLDLDPDPGVLLWMTPDGLYARPLCQSRVFWEGGHAYGDKASRLEREHSSKLLDTHTFLTELQGYALHARPLPRFQVLLFFEDNPQRLRRTLVVQVEPLFARQLLFFTQQSSTYSHALQSLPHTLQPLPLEQATPPMQDYHRVITHHHDNGLHE